MADVSEWSTVEAENTHIDELTLSGESGQYINKIMCAVKAKAESQDAQIAETAGSIGGVQELLGEISGALIYKGSVDTAEDLPDDAGVGHTYSVVEDSNALYAWNGETWIDLGANDANFVHKTGNETISGTKRFNSALILYRQAFYRSTGSDYAQMSGGSAYNKGARIGLYGESHSEHAGGVEVRASDSEATKMLGAYPDGTLTWEGQPLQAASDARLKTAMAAVPDAVLDAWEDVRWGQFQFLDAVERKGGSARLHVGIVAQAVQAAFSAHGLDACDYGILCHAEREAADGEPGFDVWTVRYAEAQAMEAACQRRRADRLEARIAALESEIRHGIDQ